jgi:hypothetical protein
VAHGLGKLIFSVRVLELIPPRIKFLKKFKKKKNGNGRRRTATDTWEEDCNGYMGSLCRKLKKTTGSFGGKKRKIREHYGFFWWRGRGFACFLGGLLNELLIFPLRLVLLSYCVMS